MERAPLIHMLELSSHLVMGVSADSLIRESLVDALFSLPKSLMLVFARMGRSRSTDTLVRENFSMPSNFERGH
jgi:hypothetical protein